MTRIALLVCAALLSGAVANATTATPGAPVPMAVTDSTATPAAGPAVSAANAAAAAMAASPLADVETAVSHGDPGGMLAARATLAARADADTKNAAASYWVAYADWRVTPMLLRDHRDQAESLVRDGIDRLAAIADAQPRNADALALLGSLEGLLISLRPADAMTLGPSAGAHLARATAAEPANPRAWLLTGIDALEKPAAYGGGFAAARKPLARARALYEQETAQTGAIRWGAADAWIWSARAELAAKDRAAARDMLHHALELDPHNRWAKDVLLPQTNAADSR